MLIQIKIIFSFMDHIINMRKGYLWDCLFPGQYSIFKNFLQILKGKIIKRNSKNKVLIHYPMGCSSRHCMPDLFISSYSHCMDPADPCGNLSWSPELYVSSLPLLEWFLVALSHGTVLFSDECPVYCSSLSWNVFWG